MPPPPPPPMQPVGDNASVCSDMGASTTRTLGLGLGHGKYPRSPVNGVETMPSWSFASPTRPSRTASIFASDDSGIFMQRNQRPAYVLGPERLSVVLAEVLEMRKLEQAKEKEDKEKEEKEKEDETEDNDKDEEDDTASAFTVSRRVECLAPSGHPYELYVGERETYVTVANSCFFLSPFNTFRITAFDALNSRWAENGTLLVIILNSITLAIETGAYNATIHKILDVSEFCFQAAFTVEMVTKIIALGFVLHPYSYLRSTWNVIDFVVVLAGGVSYLPGIEDVRVLRLVRVVRPLRTISRVAGMRTIVNSIVAALPTLLEVFLLLWFLMMIFAITGMGLFGKTWHHRCHVDYRYMNGTMDWEFGELLPMNGLIQNDTVPCESAADCNSRPYGMAFVQDCRKAVPEEQDQVLNFDTVFHSLLIVFKVISLDDWPDDMHKAQNTAGWHAYAFFMSLTVMGAYFCINLVLAILSSIFSTEADAQELNAVQVAYLMLRSKGRDVNLQQAIAANPGGLNLPGCGPQNILVSDPATKWCDLNSGELHISFVMAVAVDEYCFVTAKDAIQCDPTMWRFDGWNRFTNDWETLHEVAEPFRTPVERGKELPFFQVTTPGTYIKYRWVFTQRRMDLTFFHDASSDCSEGSSQPAIKDTEKEEKAGERDNSDIMSQNLENCSMDSDDRPAMFVSSPEWMNDSTGVSASFTAFKDDTTTDVVQEIGDLPKQESGESGGDRVRRRRASQASSHRAESPRGSIVSSRRSRSLTETKPPDTTEDGILSRLSHTRARLRRCVTHRFFNYVMMVVTVVNIVSLALDHHDIPETLESVMNHTNITCAVLFLFELLLKLSALGTKYFKDRFNILDFVLVAISSPDIFLLLKNGKAEKGSQVALSSLRVIRLARVGRFAQNFEGLRILLETVLKSIMSVAYLFLLMMLFIFIFGVLGNQLFNNQFVLDYSQQYPMDYDPGERSHFHTFQQSLLTVFVVITGESWATIMKKAITDTGTFWTSFYFLIVFALGNYVFLNLVIAILIYNFSEASGRGNEDRKKGLEQEDEEKNRKKLSILRLMHLRGVAAGTPALCRQDRQFSLASDTLSMSMSSRKSTYSNTIVSPTKPKKSPCKASTNSNGNPLVPPEARRRSTALTDHSTSSNPLLQDLSDNTPPPRRNLQDSAHGELPSPKMRSPQKVRPPVAPLAPSLNVVSAAEVAEVCANTVAAPLKTVGACEAPEADRSESLSEVLSKRNTMRSCELTPEERAARRYRLRGHSFGVFAPTNPIRIAIAHCVLHPYFTWCVMFFILVSLTFLAVDSPRLDNQVVKDVIKYGDYVFTVVFVIEAVAKSVTCGVFHTERETQEYNEEEEEEMKRDVEADDIDDAVHCTTASKGYLNVVWNRIDVFVCIASVAGLFDERINVVRSFRAVRLVVLSEDVRIFVLALFVALPEMAYVLFVWSFVWLVYGILGVQLFKGSFNYCTDLTITDVQHCVGEYEAAVITWNDVANVSMEREWVRTRYHFDNIGSAALTLFEIAVGERWAVIMYTGVDAVGGGRALERNHNIFASLYFVSFVIVGGFFAMNLFVGMLIEQFGKVKEDREGTSSLSDAQHVWLNACKVMNRTKLYKVPSIKFSNPVLHSITVMVRHRYFEIGIMSLILLNVLLMCLRFEGEPGPMGEAIDSANFVFLAIYVLEALLKIIGLGPKVYFNDNWCRFDFMLVVVTSFGHVINRNTHAMRVLRIGRLFRLVRRAKSLRKLFTTLIYALPSLANITVCVLVVFFIFGIIGMSTFGRIKYNGALDHNTNFRDLESAIVLLYLIATTETWNDVMEACMLTRDCADSDTGFEQCGTTWAILYFVSFMLIGSFIALNLFVTVLLDQFQQEDELNSEESQSKMELFKILRDNWVHFDIAAHSRVPAKVFIGILRNLPDDIQRRLGLMSRVVMQRRGRSYEGEFLSYLGTLDVPVVQVPTNDAQGNFTGYLVYVEYKTAQRALALRLFRMDLQDVVEVELLTKKRFVLDQSEFCLHHYYAARKILKSVRRVLRRKKERSGDMLVESSESVSYGHSQIMSPAVSPFS